MRRLARLMSSVGAQPPICVTGGSGFLGSWCIKLLLEDGHHVHTTTRSAKKASYLMQLPGAASRLKIFEGVDLLRPGAFDDAIAGCHAVLHTASPFYFAGGSEEKLVTPAVEGTRNVLSSCQKLGVKRVALTSSTGSVYVNYGTFPADHVYTSADWSPAELLREKQNWYCRLAIKRAGVQWKYGTQAGYNLMATPRLHEGLSKVLAEQLAWEMSKQADCPFQLTVLLPTLIWGPMVPGQPHLNTSANSLVGYMDGSVKDRPGGGGRHSVFSN
eukprot:Skav216454  [mRNA]  locus=scaffold50:708497:712440:- [translate_table: standard]